MEVKGRAAAGEDGVGTETPEPAESRVLLPALAALPGHLLWRAHGRVTLALGEALPGGLDIHAYATLLALARGGARSQQDVADAVGVSRTTMVRVAADLVEQGLVERVRNPDDRRSYALTRSPAGAAAVRRWRRHAEALETSLTAGFSATDRADLHDLLHRVCAADLAEDTPAPLLASTGFLLSRVQFRTHREFLAALGPLDLEPRHFGALTALQASGPVAQAELARLLGLSGASVVALADDLERRGLVERRRLDSDRRTQVLHLRPGAPEVIAEARRIAEASMAERLAPLTPDEVERLSALLRRFVTAP